jgi:hypothetical protein
MLYRVEVRRQGSLIESHVIEALDALTAINQVESQYGEPTHFEIVSIEDEHGRKHHVLMVSDWHGYTFEARALLTDKEIP